MYSDVVSVCFFVHTPSRLPLHVSPFVMLCKMNNYDASQSFPKQQFFLALLFFPCIPLLPQWGTADAEINAPPIKNPEVGQNIATHASSAAENFLLVLIYTSTVHFLLVLISTSTVHSPSFFLTPLHTF